MQSGRWMAMLAMVSGLAMVTGVAQGPKVVASCPAKAGMALRNVYVIEMPGDRVVPGSGGMAGTEWDLTKVSRSKGGELLLDCGYGREKDPATTPVAAKDHETRRIPASAGRCFAANSPVTGECFERSR